MRAAGRSSGWPWRRAKSCTTSAPTKPSATGSARRRACCATRAERRVAAPLPKPKRTPVPISSKDRLGIERVAVRAWPALETANLAGWLWRYTAGGAQRANSVSPLDFAGADVEAGIAEAERLYGARGAAGTVAVCGAGAPGALALRRARPRFVLQ